MTTGIESAGKPVLYVDHGQGSVQAERLLRNNEVDFARIRTEGTAGPLPCLFDDGLSFYGLAGVRTYLYRCDMLEEKTRGKVPD